MPHANTVLMEIFETKPGHTRHESGEKGQGEQNYGDDDGEGDGSAQY